MFLCQTAPASAGGGTTFLDLAALFDSLPAGLQRRLEAVTVAYVGNKHGDATPLWQQTSQKTSAGTHYGDVLSVHSVDTTVCASCATSISATEVATGD